MAVRRRRGSSWPGSGRSHAALRRLERRRRPCRQDRGRHAPTAPPSNVERRHRRINPAMTRDADPRFAGPGLLALRRGAANKNRFRVRMECTARIRSGEKKRRKKIQVGFPSRLAIREPMFWRRNVVLGEDEHPQNKINIVFCSQSFASNGV